MPFDHSVKKTLILAALLFSGIVLRAEPPKSPIKLHVIQDFESDDRGTFPAVFKTYPFQRSKALKVYSVQSDNGNRYLNATASGETQNMAAQVFDRFDWDLAKFPRISWRWRAKSLPKQPSSGHIDDNACGVYIVFGGWGGKALKYIWSTDLPMGKIIDDTPGRFYVTVKESGPKNLGQWQTVSMDINEEYSRLFHAKPEGNPTGFGLLTDGDNTHTPSACDYDDFKIEH